MKKNTLTIILAVMALALLSLACDFTGIVAELFDVGREVVDVAQAVATQAKDTWPTIEVQMTRLAVDFTQNAPSYYATATAISATARSFANDHGWDQAADQLMTNAAEFISGSGEEIPVVGVEDGLNTTSILVMNYAQSYTGSFEYSDSAHNWVFYGATGQTVSVQVSEQGSDLIAVLYGPDGLELARNTDPNPIIRVTLPSAGMYTVRIIPIVAGPYAIAYS